MILSVIVNGHREGRYLTAALRSVQQALETAGLDDSQAEVLLVLDRPDDLTSEVAERGRFSGLRNITVDFGDLGSSRNAGIAKRAVSIWHCWTAMTYGAPNGFGGLFRSRTHTPVQSFTLRWL